MNKKKGIAKERELLNLLWKKGYAVVRVAGSGNMPKPSADLIVGKNGKSFVIEVKSTRKKDLYINRKQMRELLEFAKRFGTRPLIAVKFFRSDWKFFEPEKAEKLGASYVIREKTKSYKLI